MDQPHPHANYTQPEGLWDARDVGKYLKASRSWVYHEAQAGRLPCIKLGASCGSFPPTSATSSRTRAPAPAPSSRS